MTLLEKGLLTLRDLPDYLRHLPDISQLSPGGNRRHPIARLSLTSLNSGDSLFALANWSG